MKRDTPWKHAPWTPRQWQSEALPRARQAITRGSPVVRAVTGAGKSILLAELAWLTEGRVVITTPARQLVNDLAETCRARGMKVGKYFTGSKQTHRRVTIACNDSLPSLSKKIDPPELWVADEAHKTECPTILDVILGPEDLEGERQNELAWTPETRCGFTATPYRAEESEELSLFDSLAYNYGPDDAIRDGVVVPPRWIHYDDPKFSGSASDIDAACTEMIQWGLSRDLGPGIVDSINITDAREYAEHLRGAGVAAQAIHSEQSDHTQDRLKSQLRDGDLDCLVQVSMLSEGVDLPWLRWLCCRRPVGSRVLFAQYIGRGLRTYQDKSHCIVYDPHYLTKDLGLDYRAILAGGGEDDSDGIPELPALELDWVVDDIREQGLAEQETLSGVPVKVIDPTTSYITRLRLAFQAKGLIPMAFEGREWRQEPPSSHQLRRISRDAWLVTEPDVPERHSRALRIAIRAIEGCDRGTASDLISILNVLSFGWPDEAGREVAA